MTASLLFNFRHLYFSHFSTFQTVNRAIRRVTAILAEMAATRCRFSNRIVNIVRSMRPTMTRRSIIIISNKYKMWVPTKMSNNGGRRRWDFLFVLFQINITRQEKQTTINNSCKIDDATKTQNHAYRYTGPKKPPFTYTELIEHALNEKGELTVSGIYQWIS